MLFREGPWPLEEPAFKRRAQLDSLLEDTPRVEIQLQLINPDGSEFTTESQGPPRRGATNECHQQKYTKPTGVGHHQLGGTSEPCRVPSLKCFWKSRGRHSPAHSMRDHLWSPEGWMQFLWVLETLPSRALWSCGPHTEASRYPNGLPPPSVFTVLETCWGPFQLGRIYSCKDHLLSICYVLEDSLGNKRGMVFVLCGVHGLAADDKHMNRQKIARRATKEVNRMPFNDINSLEVVLWDQVVTEDLSEEVTFMLRPESHPAQSEGWSIPGGGNKVG